VKARARFPKASPGRLKPKGVSSGWRIKTLPERQGLSEGRNPRNRGLLGRPSASAMGLPVGGTVGGVKPGVMSRGPFGRRRLRRVNPKSAAGAKQNRRGIEGRKPSRG